MKTIRKLKLLFATLLLVGWTGFVKAANYGSVTINGTTYTMTNTSTLIDADIALLDLKAQGNAGSATITANIGGTNYSGYTNVYNAVYNLLVANPTHVIPGSGGHGTNGQYIWPGDSENDAIWYIPSGKTATFQGDNAGKVGKRLVVVGGGTIKRVMDKRRFYLTGNSNLVLCLQGQLTIDGGGAPSAALAILSVASGKVYIAGSVKIKDSHGQAALDSGGGGAITLRSPGKVYMMDNAQILNCNSITNVSAPEPEEEPSPYYLSHGGAVAMFGDNGLFKMMGNAKISGCTTGYGVATAGSSPSLGGAVYMEGGTFTMNDNAKIEGCSAVVGGAIYMTDGTFEMNGGLIGSTNMTLDLFDGSTLTYPNVPTTNYNYITEITLDSTKCNTARVGGAIYAQGGSLKLNSGVIAGNSTETGAAGSGGKIINGVISYDNDDPHYIPIYYGSCILTQGTANIECHDGMLIYGNRSLGSTIFMGAGSTTTTMPHNEFYGGQVYCNLELRHYGCGITATSGVVANLRNNTSVCYNSTYRNGGGLLSLQGAEINLYDDVLVSHNTAIGVNGVTNSGNGGAFRVVGRLNIHSGTVSYNYANGYNSNPEDPNDDSGLGGAISATTDQRGGPQEIGGVAGLRIAEVNLYGGKIEHNKSSRYGGGIYLSSYMTDTATFTLQGTEISNNEAAFDGGGCYLSARQGVLIANLRNGTIANNTADRDGGGLYFNVLDEATRGMVTIGADEATNNIVITENVAVEKGGGVYVTNSTEQPAILTMMSGYVKDNDAQSHGGGFYVTGGDVTLTGGYVQDNETGSNGGGFYANGGSVLVSNWAQVLRNKALSGIGGGFYSEVGIVVDSANVADNQSIDGGGFYVGSGTTQIRNGAIVSGNLANRGAGAFVQQGVLNIYDLDTVRQNIAATSGGGIYMESGTVSVTNANIEGNVASSSEGGGIYVGNGDSKVASSVTLDGATVDGNEAATSGGGIYVAGNVTLQNGAVVKRNEAAASGGGIYVADGGNYTMTGGAIGGTTTEGNKTTGNTSYGGGLYMGGGTATITGGSISGNQTDSQGQGGGIYMDGGTCTLSNGAVIGGVPSGTQSYANSAKYGGGIYSRGGTITVKGGKLQYNTASTAGGGIYTNGADGVVNMEKQTSKAEMLSYIEYNTAEEGGGIYANRGVVNFSDGFIQYNHASEAGGGIYVNDNGGDDYGTLYLKGSANLRRNNVPTGHSGGGVYLKGKVVVGEQTANLGIIKAQENFAGDEYVYEWNDTGHPETDSIDQVTANNRNNIYLPDPGEPSVLTTHRDVITVIENGISLDSRVGFSVPHNYVPVIYCAPSSTSQDYLDQFSTGHEYQYMIFDDTRHYVAVHYPDRPDIFDRDHVYLYGFWANVVTGNEHDMECPISAADFEGQNPIEISNACELAFFISWVNGLNGLDTHADANAILLADIDMSKYGWVPIGDLTHGYSGTFDGNGHTVTGISSLLYREYLDYGFFGRLDGGTVKDLFVKDAFYALDNMPDLVIGGLVGEITTASTVENCEVSSRITATNTTTVVGGLIGRMNAGTVHSTIGISDMKGYLMGGLVGELLGGSLYNSFSNCKYTKAENHDKYMGGLAAVNRGTVENCYAREQDGSSHGSNFGSLVGDNAGGTVRYSYAPQPTSQYTVTGKEGVLEGVGTYGTTYLPYLYKHRDTQVAAANDYVSTDANADNQMMNVLNAWVEDKSTAATTYTKWGRPWQASDAEKPLNDDYPILRMPMANAVASRQGDPYLDYNDIDVLLEGYQATGDAVWMYNNSETVRGDNSSSAAKLYIAEDVALKNLNELKAYVGITLDNSAGGQGANPTYGEMLGITTDATDWHMISSPLMDAPIGIDYSDNGSYDFSWGHPEDMPYYRFHQGERHGYFPSHRYGTAYPATDANLTDAANAGNYYNEWDFYAYSEPNYHWINFKRNSNSHRHFDTEDHQPISYGNEPSLIPGKGYFAATREETFLQCQGNLNADEVAIGLTKTTGVPRHGYNLIGNPYQAYLDFDLFAEANSEDVDAIWDDLTKASYTILDEDAASYLTFAYDGSDNPDAAGRFIHPHQGFFVRTGLNGSMAYFQPDMRNTTAQNSTFRSNDHIDYPLVNLFVSEANGNSDMVTVELGRPTQGGALLMQGLRAGNGKIWCHYNDVDYAVAYTQPGVTEAAIRFETVADTEYTMRWNTHNGDFIYLHLIDNVTGADVDCLTTDEYKFSASTSDYKSRFRLVFGYTGIEEDTEAEANENFAFVMNDALVVTGEGVLQVFDMTGRLVTSQELHGVQTTVLLPNAANGVYVLRLTEGKQSRIQKMVISK